MSNHNGTVKEYYADSKFGFSFFYPKIRNWTIRNKQPGFIMFVNKLTRATFAVMVSQPQEAIADVHDLGIQVELVKSLVGSMKHVLPNASNFSFVSKENITLPQGQLKGFQVVFDFKLPQQSMVGKCVFYANQQFLYMLLATSQEGHFRAENEVFFNPAIASFTLVV